MAEEKRKRILSGIQPTGTPTLGNYIGALRRAMASTGYVDVKSFQRCSVVVNPYHV